MCSTYRPYVSMFAYYIRTYTWQMLATGGGSLTSHLNLNAVAVAVYVEIAFQSRVSPVAINYSKKNLARKHLK